MDSISDAVTLFFSSGIGILLQCALFIGALIPGLKYLNNKFNSKIDANIDKKLRPFADDLCSQLASVKGTLETFQAQTTTALQYIDKAVENINRNGKNRHNQNQDSRHYNQGVG